jgi:V8-like Glu-specific endopeptidase
MKGIQAFVLPLLLAAAAHAADPVADAGPDIAVADFDGNASATVVLDAGASTDADGDIASYAWTWPGGSAEGRLAEGSFPVTNGTITVTLTVTDALGGVATDTLTLGAYAKEFALFRDFTKQTYRDLGGGLKGRVAGNLLVIDYGGVDVFRRSAGVWTQESFPTSASDHFPVDENTIVSLNAGFGGIPQVTRFSGGSWTAGTVTLSPAYPELADFNNQRQFAFDPQTVVIADYGHDVGGLSDAGKVSVYDWAGDQWNLLAELSPPGGFSDSGNFGATIAVEGDLIVASERSTAQGGSNVFHVYRKSAGTWTHETTLTGQSPARPDGRFNWGFGLGGGVIASQVYVSATNAYTLAVYQKVAGSWVETALDPGGLFFNDFVVDDDGQAVAASSFTGNHYLFEKDAVSASWSAASVAARPLPVGDLGTTQLYASDFSGGLLTLRDGSAGLIRLIDTITAVHPVNAEPLANAGDDVATTSYDGRPVRIFLNGGGSSDIDFNETLSAVWNWQGGSASGSQTFAWIDPSVTSVELTITDSRGAISRDSIQLDIVGPPAVSAGPDVIVVDSDGDGSIRMNVSGAVISPDYPVASWNWRWPGGTLGSQSGTITIGQPADGESVTLEVIDENGLSSEASFGFRLLDPNPSPAILQPADGRNNDFFGFSVAIDGGTALVGALNKQTGSITTGATYLAENVNNLWPQYSLSPGLAKGSDVLIDGDEAFVGNHTRSDDGLPGGGRVLHYRRQAGDWVLTSTLAPDFQGFGFGLALAKSGNHLLVAASGSSINTSSDGAVYLFEKAGNSWTLVQRLTSPVPESFGRFGSSIAIHGETLAVGSAKHLENYNSGIVHVFEKGPAQWDLAATLESELSLNSLPGFDSYGRSLAINSTEILAGAPADPANPAGSVYRFSRIAGVWTPNGRILPQLPPAANVVQFGAALHLKDDILVIGVPGDGTGTNEGSVATYLLKDGDWDFRGSLAMTSAIDPFVNPNGVSLAASSSAIDHDGKDLIVGAADNRNPAGVQTGKAYIYRNYAALNPGANYEPVADVGADINVNDTLVRGPAPGYGIVEPLGSEEVTLDGSGSADRENSIVSYAWTWPGGGASGINPSARFPVGTTTVTLTVTDDKGILNSDSVVIRVALLQTPPAALPGTGNTLTVNLPVPDARWRLSSEFLWHGNGESADDVVLGETYQIEIIAYPGSADAVTTFVTINDVNSVADLSLILPVRAPETGALRFPETAQGFAWRLAGEAAWRDVADDNNGIADDIDFVLPVGDYRIEFKPVAGYATPAARVVTVRENLVLGLNWGDYLRIDNFDAAKTFDPVPVPDLAGSPYQYVGMIRTPLGRGSGTVVAERVVLTAGHLFFDSTGLQWADTQWFPRQQQDTRQAPPLAPRGILYRTSYAKLVAPDFVEGTVADLPDDDQEVDFAVLYFSDGTEWTGGSANFLQSSAARNWMTGTESKHALAYPQRGQPYELRGRMFGKLFSTPLNPLDDNVPARLYETPEVFGDGGASGSALFVRPEGASGLYPAAILLAGQGRAVYHVIDEDVGRMIKDGQDAASGNDEVLDNNSSLVTFGGLGGFTTLAVNIATPAVLPTARWAVTPNSGPGYSNIKPTQQIGFNEKWASFTITFTAVSGYVTPPPVTFLNNEVTRNATNTLPVIYERVSGYDLWKQARGITSDEDDRDNDGRSALIEYALNGNPDGGPDPVPIRVAAAPLQSVNAEFEVFVSSTADAIRYEVKASDTLPPTNIVSLATFTKAGGTNGYQRVVDSQPRSASPRRFAWVEITHDRSLSTGP